VFNGEQLLPGTVESVLSQDFTDYEYWIIDGASKDGTLALIESYAAQNPQMHWISERDKGLYDAMNKGLARARGEFVWFLNGGDHLHASDTLRRTAAMIGPQTDVLYGETLLVDDARRPQGTMSELSTRSLPQQLHWRDFLRGMLVVHQSFVPRTALAGPYMDGNLCADYDWCIKILKQSREARNTGLVLTNYLMGGLSKQKHRQSLKDRFVVMRKHYGLIATLAAHGYIVLRAIWHKISRIGKQRY
jgi:glycosyltransferase involved in cell wall biosynthesis